MNKIYFLIAASCSLRLAAAVPAHLPGELSADEILNGAYPFPPSPPVAVSENWNGFATNRLSKIPPPGVHPRILFSPEDLPDLRQRIAGTQTGRELIANLRERVATGILKADTWENNVFEKLATGDTAGALTILNSNPKPNSAAGHYQPYFLYLLVMESFDALVKDDPVAGKKVAAAIAGYAKMVAPLVDDQLLAPLNDDVWRVKVAGPTTGNWSSNQGIRDLLGYHNLGYAYDFAAPWMTDAQRATVRGVIAKVTAGRVWLGARLPHHFRNWNWVAVGLQQPLLSLAIEGEDGYDPRVFRLGVQIARDYLSYGISESGCSTEAVGYTQFGLVWGDPFFVAATRRGENLLVLDHHRKMIDWYLQSMEPFAPRSAQFAGGDAEQSLRSLPSTWTSHGDGGVEGPSVWTMAMWKYFFPQDPKIDFLWQTVIHAGGKDQLKEKIHIIEPLIFCSDGLKPEKDYADGAKLNLPVTWFDPKRSSLIARSGWSADALALQFECRTDSVGGSHEHADRGSFTLSALGRSWAHDSFRSVETKYHNCVLIDGVGQGFWPGPGRWLGLHDDGKILTAACDAKDCYDWWWPKQVVTEPENFIRFEYPRWDSYRDQAAKFRQDNAGVKIERDPRPSVVAHWTGFTAGDPRMWDEDSWPVRLLHNPVERAFRSVALVRGDKPFVLVADDIQKDGREHLYEWQMMTGPDTELASAKDNDVLLCDATLPRNDDGTPRLKKGDRLLLVRVLRLNNPAQVHEFQSKPAVRLETFEKKDTLVPDAGPNALSGSRSFGLDKRLVIPSRSVSPDFVVLLFPLRQGDALPVTQWNSDCTRLEVKVAGKTTAFSMIKDSFGCTLLQADE